MIVAADKYNTITYRQAQRRVVFIVSSLNLEYDISHSTTSGWFSLEWHE